MSEHTFFDDPEACKLAKLNERDALAEAEGMTDVDESITQALMLQGRLPKVLRDLIDRARAAPPTAANYNWLVKALVELEGMVRGDGRD